MLLVFGLTAEGRAASSASGAPPCADPAVDVELALIAKSGPGAGRVRVTAIMKNSGNAAWTATGPSHHLQMVLTRADGAPVQPAIAIRQLAPGQQYRIDHQTNWDVNENGKQPRFIVRFFDSGRAGARPASRRADCRSDNNRRDITAADINRLFEVAPPPRPLRVQGYRMLGGIGINTVETQLAYHRGSAGAGKLTASVAAPHVGTFDDVAISGNSGTATIRVHVPCEAGGMPGPNPAPVTITYRLWSALTFPGGSGWVPSSSVEQTIPYRELCGPVSTSKSNR